MDTAEINWWYLAGLATWPAAKAISWVLVEGLYRVLTRRKKLAT